MMAGGAGRRPPSPSGRRPVRRCRAAAREAQELQGHVPAPGPDAQPRAAQDPAGRCLRDRQRHLCRHRAEDPRQCHGHHLQRGRQPADPGRSDQGAGGRRAQRGRSDTAGPDAREHERHARLRHRFHGPAQHPPVRRGDLHLQLGVQLGAGLRHGRRVTADRLPDAPRRRPEAVADAAELLRQPPARRHAEPRHQRHRQHRQLAPADDDPAHHRGLHDHRRDRDHVLDQPAAGRHLAADGAAVDRRHDVHRQALVGPVRRPVGTDRQAQRPRRGDAYRARHRQGVRPAAGGDRPVRGGERGALPGELSCPVPVGHDPADHGLHRQHQLRA